MPEGPELYKAAVFLNHIASKHIFKTIRLLQKPSEKHPLIPWTKPRFSLAGEARGKEIRITISEVSLKDEVKNDKFVPEKLNILLTFGMAGRFALTKTDETQKHSMLMFDTTDDYTFSFVDTRHFGRWILTDNWSPPAKRGPSIISEYELFRKHILSSLSKSAFEKPICELMLEQRYFSCIGNYLRAEILYRLDIDPYISARSVLENLPEHSCDKNPDILKMCHVVCWEVVNLKGSGKPYDPEGIYGDHGVFEAWLQCYMKEGMGNTIDNKGRTMWHSTKYGQGKDVRHAVSPAVKSEKSDDVGASATPKRRKRAKKVKSEPLEDENGMKTDATVIKTEKTVIKTEKTVVKTEPIEDVSFEIKVKVEHDEEFDGSVIKRRSSRLKRIADESDSKGNSGNSINKSIKSKRLKKEKVADDCKENSGKKANKSVRSKRGRKGKNDTTSPYFN